MGIREISAVEISCSHCDTTIVLRTWCHAEDRGWILENTANLHLCPQCVKKQPKEMSVDGRVAELKAASPAELLRAAQFYYASAPGSNDPCFLLSRGFDIAGKGGWQYVLWSWLRDSRAQEAGQEEG